MSAILQAGPPGVSTRPSSKICSTTPIQLPWMTLTSSKVDQERFCGQHGCSHERSTLGREVSKDAPVPDLHLHSALEQLVADPLVHLLVREDVSELARNVDGGDDARLWVEVRELDNVARLKQSVEELVLLLMPDLERVVRVVGRRDLAFGKRRTGKQHRHPDVVLWDWSVDGVGRGRRERVRGVDGRGRRGRVLALVRACSEDHGDGAVPLADDVALHDLGRHPCLRVGVVWANDLTQLALNGSCLRGRTVHPDWRPTVIADVRLSLS